MLELKDVHIQQGTFSLSGSLVVNRGERLAIIGPSGAGKSTLLRCVAGLERARHGYLDVDGERWEDSDAGVFRAPYEGSLFRGGPVEA